ncbi:hypothetical protein RFI_27770 [Reticulomyxa filosa]|uniref:Uncharacterized protein n=1 Tax=Reticulomyxa filosa TaxID=46433 RepID=X6M6R7_RETFI|nr:hypothetical protein RFI_27770 [Reticulomyxa filosa]|eukprot:ETO09609.1 hypothetical protein RFI_27770 [Reticulomyxa filosa]
MDEQDSSTTYNTEDPMDINLENLDLIKKYVTPEFFVRDKAFIAHLGNFFFFKKKKNSPFFFFSDATALITGKECLLFNDPIPYIQQKFLFTLNQKLIEYRTLHLSSQNESSTQSQSQSQPQSQSQSQSQVQSQAQSQSQTHAQIHQGHSTPKKLPLAFEVQCLDALCKSVVSVRRRQMYSFQNKCKRILQYFESQQKRGFVEPVNIAVPSSSTQSSSSLSSSSSSSSSFFFFFGWTKRWDKDKDNSVRHPENKNGSEQGHQ